MYKVEPYQNKIISENEQIRAQFNLIKKLSEDFTKSNSVAIDLDNHLYEVLSKIPETENESNQVNEPSVLIDIPEIELNYIRPCLKKFSGKVNESELAAKFIREVIGEEHIKIQEYFIVVLLDNGANVIGFYRHSVGGINQTIVDLRVLYCTILKSLAVDIVISHNHPSGSLSPSSQDKAITVKIQKIGKLLDITVVDHLIITQDSYFSFADEGLLSNPNDSSVSGFKKTSSTKSVIHYQPSKIRALIEKGKNLKF